jgi:hypothetical protein
MQRIYIFLIIAVIVFAASYNDSIKQFFTPEKPGEKTVSEQKKITARDESYEQLRIDLYRIATTLSDLQGKAQLLKMAQENREWFTEENYAHLDVLIETTERELATAQEAYEKAKKEFTKITVQKMVEEYSSQQ